MTSVPVLVGPTAVGKTALSLELAERLGAEIVSADSRQVYRGLDIGTAKPSREERARVRHHFIDERAPGEPWSAGTFAEEAVARMADIFGRGRLPLVVGGSTLYLEALLFGLADVPKEAPEVRAALTRKAATPEGARALYDELARVDPAGARTLDPTKTQRLVRALGVYRTTGRPWSSFHARTSPPPHSFRIVVLNRPREELYARIEARVDAMLDAGLLEENQALLDAGYALDTNPLRTIGYQEPIAYLRGEIEYDEMVRLLKRNSRRYAKRQLTWFRRWQTAVWADPAQDVAGLLQ